MDTEKRMVRYSSIETENAKRRHHYEVGQDGVWAIEHEAGTLTYLVFYKDGTTIHFRSTEIVDLVLSDQEVNR